MHRTKDTAVWAARKGLIFGVKRAEDTPKPPKYGSHDRIMRSESADVQGSIAGGNVHFRKRMRTDVVFCCCCSCIYFHELCKNFRGRYRNRMCCKVQ